MAGGSGGTSSRDALAKERGRLRAALLGLSGVGAEYAAALRADDRFELVGAADRDADLLRERSEALGCEGYSDFRSLVVENARQGLDILFVALPPHESHEFVALAARHSVGVFHPPPFARSVTEGRQLLAEFENAGVSLVVERRWQHDPAFAKLQTASHLIGRVFGATATVRVEEKPAGWRGDARRAGGGVLLNHAYRALDLLTFLMGMPDEVYAQAILGVPPGASRPYDTEDLACLTLRYPEDRAASLAVVRGACPAESSIWIVGEQGAMAVDDVQLKVFLGGGGGQTYRVAARHPAAPAISALAESLLEGTATASKAQEHLGVLAVIEAAYLSARTGDPETPGKFL